ncbi:MAG: hypothetical protein EXR62_16415 [Chloroflexi bacterium]|nr:hypothetical protein [Chloroflexota bacterium]
MRTDCSYRRSLLLLFFLVALAALIAWGFNGGGGAAAQSNANPSQTYSLTLSFSMNESNCVQARPINVAFGQDGYTYVLAFCQSALEHRLLAYDFQGFLVSEIMLRAAPTDIAVGRDRSIFILTPYALLKQNYQGQVEWIAVNRQGEPFDFSGSSQRGGLALDGNGNVFATDSGNHQVLLFSGRSGELIRSWGPLAGVGHLEGPNDLALGPDGSVYVADSDLHAVMHFSPEGQYLDQVNLGASFLLYSVTVDRAGNVFALHNGRRIDKYAPDGTLLAEWGQRGRNPANFLGYGLSSDSQNRIYVVDQDNQRALAFARVNGTPTPQPVTPTPTPIIPVCHVTVDKRAAPDTLELGDTTEIQLNLTANCANPDFPSDIYLVIDVSGSMSLAQKLVKAKDAALSFIDLLDITRQQIGVIYFESDAHERAHISQICYNRWQIARPGTAGHEDFDDADFDDTMIEIEALP